MCAKIRLITVLMGVSMISMGEAIRAEDEVELIGATEKCISLTRLRRTDIVDDRNVLFYMRGGEIYLNQLPNRCSGLRSADRFSYRPTVNRLCNIDTITPLQDAGPGGLGLRGGVSCPLGNFQSITEDEVMVLTEKGAPDTQSDGESAEIEPLDEDAPDEPAEIESID